MMAKRVTPSRKDIQPGMRKMVVEIPDRVFKALKLRAVEQDTTMKGLVAEALQRYLGLKERGGRRKR